MHKYTSSRRAVMKAMIATSTAPWVLNSSRPLKKPLAVE